jgi:hypothetical protein
MQPLYYFNVKPNIEISESQEFIRRRNDIKESSTPCFLGSPNNEELIKILNMKESVDKPTVFMKFNIDKFESFGGGVSNGEQTD